jgi:hypothetical protein
MLHQVTGGGDGTDLAALVRAASTVHDNADALDALEVLRGSPVDMAFVVDEHGTFQGLLEAIVGQFVTHEAEAEPDAVQREDGSWLLAGWKPVDDMAELLKLALPQQRDYHTVAGFALARLGRFSIRELTSVTPAPHRPLGHSTGVAARLPPRTPEQRSRWWSALRKAATRRWFSSSRKRSARAECSARSISTRSWPSSSTRASVRAEHVAERGSPSSRLISPKIVPGPIVWSTCRR